MSKNISIAMLYMSRHVQFIEISFYNYSEILYLLGLVFLLSLGASFPLGFQKHVTSHMETVYRPESTNEDDLTKMEHVSPQLGSPCPTAIATA